MLTEHQARAAVRESLAALGALFATALDKEILWDEPGESALRVAAECATWNSAEQRLGMRVARALQDFAAHLSFTAGAVRESSATLRHASIVAAACAAPDVVDAFAADLRAGLHLAE